jgi:hypothetical protein
MPIVNDLILNKLNDDSFEIYNLIMKISAQLVFENNAFNINNGFENLKYGLNS